MKRRLILLTVAVSIIVGVSAWVRGQLAVEARDQPVTEADLHILQRAEVLLKDPSMWNRHDDRVCDDDEALGKRSLFCALQKADTEVLGSYAHRNVALKRFGSRFRISLAVDKPRRSCALCGISACPTGSWTSTICRKRGSKTFTTCCELPANVSLHD